MPECLDDYRGKCRGPVEFHSIDPGFRRAFPRCEKHWGEAVDREMALRERYPVHAPADFDESYAGERWDDDY